jgi:cytochrome c oxidase assembly protein subunit 15
MRFPSNSNRLGSVLSTLIFTGLVVLQIGLVITGGAVRLTGSGLGCPTWPECTPGSFKPIPHQVQGQVHAWIEFGNRLLTFLLFVFAIAALVAAFKLGKKLREPKDQSRVKFLALAQVLGILGQGVLGGITVLTHLNPIPVAGHFLLSIALIAGALSLRQKMKEKIGVMTSVITKKMSQVLLGLTVLILTLGTIVTGSGPHAGDIKAKRFGFDPKTVSWIHADTVIALICLTIGLILVVHTSEPAEVKAKFGGALKIFLFISLAQGAIGYIQYFTKLPEIIVGLHLLGASLVWLAMWNLILTGNIIMPNKGSELK